VAEFALVESSRDSFLLKIEVLIVVKMFVTSCKLVGRYQRLEGAYVGSEDGGSVFVRNVGKHLQVYTAS
jgi:hypothetical protein